LLFTDYNTFVAVYDHENWAVFTHGTDGTRSYRFNGFSAYIYSDGRGTWATASGSIAIMEDWVWIEDENDEWPIPKETLVEMEFKYSSKLLTMALGLNTQSHRAVLPSDFAPAE